VIRLRRYYTTGSNLSHEYEAPADVRQQHRVSEVSAGYALYIATLIID
jgi:hypothetical protein